MTITSPSFMNGQAIPKQYTCDGEDHNPPLEFSQVPFAAKSLALIVDDPDAPAGTWVHWTIWNIDPSTRRIKEGSVPQGAIEGITSFGRPGYGGPCPPSGAHRYFFKLYALDTVLTLPPSAPAQELTKAMEGRILAMVELMGTYQRR